MRVLQLIPNLLVGGAEKMVVGLSCGLASRRIEVHVAIIGSSIAPEFAATLAKSNIPVTCLGKPNGFHWRAARLLSRLITEIRPDVVHTHLGAIAYCLPATVLNRAPRLVHSFHSLADWEASGVHALIRRLALLTGVTPVGVGPEVSASVRERYRLERCETIANGIDVDTFVDARRRRSAWRSGIGLSNDALVLTSVGRLAPEKNHSVLVDGFAELLKQGIDAVLLLIGDGPNRSLLKQQIDAASLQKRILLLGNRSDVSLALGASDIFVLPSLVEGTPLALQEAMAAGCAVVASSVGGIPALLGHGKYGFLLPAHSSVAEVASTISTLAFDEARRRALAQDAQAFAKAHFDQHRMVAQYTRLYGLEPVNE